MTDPEELIAQRAVVRRQGDALDEGEQEVGVRCVAVAVPGSSVPLAVSLPGPTTRMSDDLLTDAVPALQDAAPRLGAELS